MHYRIKHLIVIGDTAYTEPIPLGNDNAVSVTFDVVACGDSAVEVAIQEGSDLENWTERIGSRGTSIVGRYSFCSPKLVSRYFRLRVRAGGSLVKMSVDTSRL